MHKYLTEFIASILFVYVILATGNPLAIGATLSIIMLLVNSTVNPAVSITMASIGQLPVADLVPICIAQILGGLVALEVYKRYKI
jgi:glycerol uptake facilitator-like aquaporin